MHGQQNVKISSICFVLEWSTLILFRLEFHIQHGTLPRVHHVEVNLCRQRHGEAKVEWVKDAVTTRAMSMNT